MTMTENPAGAGGTVLPIVKDAGPADKASGTPPVDEFLTGLRDRARTLEGLISAEQAKQAQSAATVKGYRAELSRIKRLVKADTPRTNTKQSDAAPAAKKGKST